MSESNTTELATRRSNEITPMLQTLLERGTGSPGEMAAAMERLTDLWIKVDAIDAAKAFAVAKCKLQAALPRVAATRTIPGSDGVVRSSFAAYEDIFKVIAPYLQEHGFSISFTIRNDNGDGKDRICAVCKLTHVGGHYETNEFSVRISSPPKCSDAQADGATRSYARRGALCDCLNIIVDHDDDARMEGNYITAEIAADLEKRVKAVGGDSAILLAMAGANNFREVREGSLLVLDRALKMKERAKKQPAARSSPVPVATTGSAAAEIKTVMMTERPVANSTLPWQKFHTDATETHGEVQEPTYTAAPPLTYEHRWPMGDPRDLRHGIVPQGSIREPTRIDDHEQDEPLVAPETEEELIREVSKRSGIGWVEALATLKLTLPKYPWSKVRDKASWWSMYCAGNAKDLPLKA